MQTLLLASDILITDYSSVMFDFELLKRPCFLYCPDFEDYVKKERKTYFSLQELPFTLDTSNEALISSILAYDEEEYLGRLRTFDERIGSFERGHACEKIIEWISNRFEKNEDN